jgi:hypothetical protein
MLRWGPKVVPVEPRAIVERDRHRAVERVRRLAEQRGDDRVERHDPAPERMDRGEVGGERSVVVVGRRVADDVDRVVGQHRHAHRRDASSRAAWPRPPDAVDGPFTGRAGGRR